MTPEAEEKCFVCSKIGGNMNIFTTYNICKDKEELYVDVIKNCYNIEIGQDTGLNVICTDCSIKLRKAYTFKNDMTEAISRLILLQDAVDVDAVTPDIKSSKPNQQADHTLGNDFNINTVTNTKTGYITYTLNQINVPKEPTNKPDTYLINLYNDAITKTEAEIKVTKPEQKNKNDVVKKDLPTKIQYKEEQPKAKISKVETVKKDLPTEIQNKETQPIAKISKVETVKKDLPTKIQNKEKQPKAKISKVETVAVVLENSGKINKVIKNVTKTTKRIITIDGKLVHMTCTETTKEKKSRKRPKIGEKAKEPKFTLEPGQKKCNMCSTEFETNKALRVHMNSHYPEHNCSECDMAFATSARLRNHVNQIHNTEESVICKHCNKEFANVNTRNSHMWRVHTTPDPFKCSQCGERFKTYLKRLRHMQSFHADSVTEYPCAYCDKKFGYAAYRTKHIRTVHLESRPYKCKDCPYSFARRRELNAHRANKHGDGEMKYECDVCGKKFFYNNALKFHHKLHDRYSCTQCSKKFFSESLLESHQKTHQKTPEKTYQKPHLETPQKTQESVDHPYHMPSLDPVLHLDEFSDYALDPTFWALAAEM